MKRSILLILVTLLVTCHLAVAQDDDPPGIALLSFGPVPVPYSISESVILAQLYVNGYLSEEEYSSSIDTRGDIEGERVNIFSLDANWELSLLNTMLENAIDREADVLVAFTTPVAQAAVNATMQMDDPPVVLFASVFYPFDAGIAQSPCIKPSHVTGTQIIPPYDQLVSLVKLQHPGISLIGTLFSSDQISGVQGSLAVVEAAEKHGIEAREAAVTHPVDFSAAIEGLVSNGVEAVVLSIDTITSRGLPAIMAIASDNLLPIYYPSLGGVSSNAMISAGYFRQYEQGLNISRMLLAVLSGELDVAATAIDSITGDGVGVNLDVAETLQIDIVPEILEMADLIIDFEGEGQVRMSPRLEAADENQIDLLGGEDAAAADKAYLESLHCTPEMIAEQQAELDAAEE